MTRNQTPFDRSLVEGPLGAAVWKLAWPTLLQNVVAGLQGIVDHVMVGHYVGFTGNAAIGVAWQIFLVVVVFIASLSSGMTVLVARAAGAGESARVNRVVYQGLLAGALMYVLLAGIGYVAAPHLLTLVNATEAVRDEALPYLRIMFVFSIGMLMFYLLGGALRAAGDARTPLRLGLIVTVLNLVFNVILIRGLGPVPAFGTTGAAMGTVAATGIVSSYAIALLFTGKLPIHFTSHMGWRPDGAVIRSLFRFGLPTGFQGIAMNIGGIVLLGYVGSLELSAEAQAVFAVGYTQLFSLIAWSSNALMQASAALAGTKPRRRSPGPRAPRPPAGRAGRLGAGDPDRGDLLAHSRATARPVRHDGSGRRRTGERVSHLPERVWAPDHTGTVLHGGPTGDGRHEEPHVHFDRLAAPASARDLCRHRRDAQPRACGHLAGHRPGPCGALQPLDPAFPPGALAGDRSGYGELRGAATSACTRSSDGPAPPCCP